MIFQVQLEFVDIIVGSNVFLHVSWMHLNNSYWQTTNEKPYSAFIKFIFLKKAVFSALKLYSPQALQLDFTKEVSVRNRKGLVRKESSWLQEFKTNNVSSPAPVWQSVWAIEHVLFIWSSVILYMNITVYTSPLQKFSTWPWYVRIYHRAEPLHPAKSVSGLQIFSKKRNTMHRHQREELYMQSTAVRL